jgi:hypothetical protein
MTISWKDTLDTSKKHYGHISEAQKAAKFIGYEYFAWNGWVYNTYSCLQVNPQINVEYWNEIYRSSRTNGR